MKTHYDAAVMHDFFVDRLVHIEPSRLAKLVNEKARRGGGGVHGIAQEEIRGGNAVNLAHALAKLGLRTLLITHSDPAHEQILRGPFVGLPAELRVKPLVAGMTVALEGSVNVMLGDRGGAARFGPGELDAGDWEGLARAKVVCVVNWAGNEKGTRLLESVRSKLGKRAKIFFDPADFRDRVPEFRALLRLITSRNLVNWISMNESEATAAARAIGLRPAGLGETCRQLARRLGACFDLHGAAGSYTSDGHGLVRAPAPRVKPMRLTGAGDVWDAGSIYGRLQGWGDRKTLEFANVAARLYLKSVDPVPPTLDQVYGALS